MKRLHPPLLLMVLLSSALCLANQPLIVVEDRGGTPALPYYQALNLGHNISRSKQQTPLARQQYKSDPYSEADMLPARTPSLTPGKVTPRAIRSPGMTPFFLVGNDPLSRAWLRQQADVLRNLDAMGLVVNVDTLDELEQLRDSVPGLTLSPVSADELAGRLGLKHYPVLITATEIRQ
ncbi:integrating conjugative element protein [Porticoccus sp.]|uniref:integrating conjugative element protein n=1 Tax=Porticoccus sp. TaxID=2024853 RepID=UPI000C6476DC|nr:integrating conjugative element protein [Porticoccus sp.]MAZ71222.1 integrating conjugative element protein [Porticoccus sp.]|tara:strand:+ start:9949 stop:10482 length:534 start_codon:yes stop_codon:yes gene_type:complete